MEFELDANKVKDEAIDNKPIVNSNDTSTSNTDNVIDDASGTGTVDDPMFDDNDNLIDKEGNVIKTKEQLEQEIVDDEAGDDAERVELERLASEGNEEAKAKLAELDKAPTVAFDFDSLTEATGFKPTDADGNSISFDMTPKGIADYANELGTHIANIKMGDHDSHMLRKHPVLEDVVYHLEANGTLEGFDFNANYAKIDVAKLSEIEKIDLVTRHELSKGESPEEAKAMAILLKDAGKLDVRAKIAVDTLAANDRQAKAATIAKVNENRAAHEAKVKKYWGDIDELVNTRKSFKNINIPPIIKVKLDNGGSVDKTSDDFYKYLTTPVHQDKNGTQYSQWNIDVNNSKKVKTVEDDLLEAYMLFTKSDLTSIVNDKANTKQANDFRKKYAKYLANKKSKSSNAATHSVRGAVKASNIVIETGSNR